VSTYVPDRRRLLALERERALRSGPAAGLPEVAWLDRAWIEESRAVAACILRASACCWDVSPADVKWAAEWVAADEGWQESWAALPDKVSREA
jgi:hypothetical protein